MISKDKVTEIAIESCDKDTEPAFRNGFWTLTEDELVRVTQRIYNLGLERAAEIMEGQHTWITNVAASAAIREEIK